jgi:LuxR family transcriptional regulator
MRDYLQFLANCGSLEELWDAHIQKMSEYGFDRLIYGFTRYRTSESLGDPDDFIILSNHNQCYLDVFLGEQKYIDAPMVKWALCHDGAASWDIIDQMYRARTMTAAEERFYRFNQSNQVTAGYTISFRSVSPRTKGAIALTARSGLPQAEVNALWEAHGADIHLMNNIAHLKILTLPHSPPARVLTTRQREALEWVGDGKTTHEIAGLMGLTPPTVEKHLRLARAALAVETTAQAVLKAALSNQMFTQRL